ncbi:hypothetical protein ACICHK_41865 (plasmid) [Streptomyces sp. AHU1]|uniref:hypothetical protein n=1 Tax=Streptomyces sp. AHU1 TaxID=3377215 RepID=UPI003877C3E7
MPQMNQRGHQPVDEHQLAFVDRLVASAGSLSLLPDPASRSMAATLGAGLPQHGRLPHQTCEMTLTDPNQQQIEDTHDHHPNLLCIVS